MSRFAASVRTKREQLTKDLRAFDNPIDLARRTYVGGIIAQRGADNLWPDANSTLRFTYGQVRGYSPVDGVEYQVPTTLRGVMEKERPHLMGVRCPRSSQGDLPEAALRRRQALGS